MVVSAVYVEYATHPAVAGALKGMGAVSAGLIVGTALKLSSALRVNIMGRGVCLALALTVFVAVALLSWPLAWVLVVLGLAASIYAWRRLRADNASQSVGK